MRRPSQNRAAATSLRIVAGDRLLAVATSASVKPPKYLQLDDLRLTRIERSQVVERFVERHDIEVLAARWIRNLGERTIGPRGHPALTRALLARVVNEDLSHQTRGDPEKMGAVVPLYVAVVDQAACRPH